MKEFKCCGKADGRYCNYGEGFGEDPEAAQARQAEPDRGPYEEDEQ